MFNADAYKNMYARFMGPLSRPILLVPRVDNLGWEEYDSKAHVTAYRESDLVPGGTAQLGDLKLIIQIDDLPDEITSMELKDRIVIDGMQYAVIHWDAYTRTVGSEGVAIEVTVRGGGVYIQQTLNIISEDGLDTITEVAGSSIVTDAAFVMTVDTVITEDGNKTVTELYASDIVTEGEYT